MTREEERLGAALEFYDKHKSAASNVTLVDSFVYGAKWGDRTMTERACEWLMNNAHLYVYATTKEKRALLFDNFKKAMEE